MPAKLSTTLLPLKGIPLMTFKFRKQMLLLFPILLGVVFATQRVASAPPLPNPVLYLMGTEPYQANGKQFIRYTYDVMNKDSYPEAMFAAAPALPPCGTNNSSSRTWVDIFDQTGKHLYGFCSLAKPGDLKGIYFGLEDGVVPPSWIYIELTDRQTNTKYKSNLAETTP